MKEELEFITLYIKNVSYIKLLNFIKKQKDSEDYLFKLKLGFTVNREVQSTKKSVTNILKFEFNQDIIKGNKFQEFLSLVKEFLSKEKPSDFKIEYTTRQIIGNLKI